MPVKIDPLKCTGCGNCTYLCPTSALTIDELKCRILDGCTGCGACVEACSFQAIKLEK